MVAMRRYFRNLLRTLDGAPPATPSRRARRGQSLVEMTLIMPILLVMLLGLIEIAWLANHFLILMDVTRSAARFGATGDPLDWPDGEEHNLERMDCDTLDGGSYVDFPDNHVFLPITDRSHLPGVFVDGADSPIGYFDGVACAAVQNMAPLIFDTTKDDLAVSVFAFVSEDIDTDGNVEIRITGRFPARQNECSNEPYDPFDVNHNGSYDPREDQGRMYDGVEEVGPADNDENIRGYVLTGHHEVSDAPGCIGSEFSTQEVEDLLNGASTEENQYTPNNGLLLVEMFWHHRQLLQLRWFTAIGDNFELHVWSMYPVTAVEPTATPS
jgi:hypothetical protein